MPNNVTISHNSVEGMTEYLHECYSRDPRSHPAAAQTVCARV